MEVATQILNMCTMTTFLTLKNFIMAPKISMQLDITRFLILKLPVIHKNKAPFVSN